MPENLGRFKRIPVYRGAGLGRFHCYSIILIFIIIIIIVVVVVVIIQASQPIRYISEVYFKVSDHMHDKGYEFELPIG